MVHQSDAISLLDLQAKGLKRYIHYQESMPLERLPLCIRAHR